MGPHNRGGRTLCVATTPQNSNTFFADISDKERMILGCKAGVEIPFGLTLIINIGQVYYDSNLANNSIDGKMNFGLDVNYNF